MDLEPIRPGEEEAGAALRLLGRMRRLYGPRFFDAVTVDAWYATGPFIKAVQRLGWGVVSVLKQERYEIYQEATALTKGQAPQRHQWEDGKVELWEAKDLSFNLFEWFSRLHGKLLRLGQTTLQEIARQLFLALARWEELEPLWSG